MVAGLALPPHLASGGSGTASYSGYEVALGAWKLTREGK